MPTAPGYENIQDPTTGMVKQVTTPIPPSTTGVTALSTQDAATTVKTADNTLKDLTSSAERYAPPTPTGDYSHVPGSPYYRDNKTGQDILGIDTTASPQASTSDEQNLAKIFGGDQTGKDLTAATGSANELKAELNTLRSSIDSFRITDQQLNSQIGSITSRWDARIVEMQDINVRREKAFETLGFRTGAQFSGGIRAGVFGGVIAEEERQGVMRIGQLEAQKSSEIANAQGAARKQNWDVYVEKVKEAQNLYDKQLGEVERLNKLYVEQQKAMETEKKAIAKTTRQVGIDNAVVDLYNQGLSAQDILQSMNYDETYAELGGVKLDEIQKSIEFFDKMKPELIDPLAGAGTDVKSFAAMFPDLKIGTPEFQQQFLRWQARVAAAGRAPKQEPKPKIDDQLLQQAAGVIDPKSNPQMFGEDGFMYDTNYNELANLYIQQGGDIRSFNEAFARYLSPVNRTKWLDKATGFKALESGSNDNPYR